MRQTTYPALAGYTRIIFTDTDLHGKDKPLNNVSMPSVLPLFLSEIEAVRKPLARLPPQNTANWHDNVDTSGCL
jgi:hypothetical protein